MNPTTSATIGATGSMWRTCTCSMISGKMSKHTTPSSTPAVKLMIRCSFP